MLFSLLLLSYAEEPDEIEAEGEDQITEDESVDSFSELEDAQAGDPGNFEQRLWLSSGKSPADGQDFWDTLELSYTGKGIFNHTELDFAQYFEYRTGDEASGFEFGVMQRFVKDGGKKSAIPSIGLLTEYYLRTPGLSHLPAFKTEADAGDNVAAILTAAKYAGPGILYLNGEGGHALFNQDGATWTFAGRVGYKLPLLPDKLDMEADLSREVGFLAGSKSPEDSENLGNISMIWHVAEHWTLSPGCSFGLDGHADTPAYEAGLFLLHE